MRGTDLEGRYVPSQNRYYLPNGMGTIWLLGADHPGGLEGGQFDFIWVDEGGQLKYDAWIALQGRSGQKQAPIFITTTPYGENWLYHKFYQLWLAGDPDYQVVQWSSKANPAYPDEEYDRAKRSMSAERASQRYDGQFLRLTGRVYPDLESCVLAEHEESPPGDSVGGIDFGFNDPFVCLRGKIYMDDSGKPVLYVYYERYMRKTTNDRHAKAIPSDTLYFADPSEAEAIRALSQAGHTVRKAKNAILPGIDCVNEIIYNGQLRISPVCKALIWEGSNFRYPEKDDETYGEKPMEGNDHAMDALRYLCMGVRRQLVQETARNAA